MKGATYRKLGAVIGAIGLLAALPAAGEAQVVEEEFEGDGFERGILFDGRAGVAVPAGDLADFTDPGFNAGLGLGYRISPRLTLRLDGDMSMLEEAAPETGPTTSQQSLAGDLTLWQYNGGLQIHLLDPRGSDWTLAGSVNAGATTIDPDTEGETVPGVEDPGTETRFTGGAGLSLGYEATENVELFVRGKTYAIFLQEEDFEDGELEDPAPEDEIADTFWSFPVQAGLQVTMP